MKKRKFTKLIISAFAVLLCGMLSPEKVDAKVLDEILDYKITVDVNPDATLEMQYDIKWKVLDSDSEGPLSWVSIGLSNRNYSMVEGLTPNITSIEMTDSGGTYAEIHFDRSYYKDEVAEFSFKVTMDNMYTAYPDEGYVEYVFTPGWFDNIDVDTLTIMWNNENMTGWSPECLVDGGYNVWTTSLYAGDKFTVTAKYPSDAYAFDMAKKQDSGSSSKSGYDFGKHNAIENFLYILIMIFGGMFGLMFVFLPYAIPALIIYTVFKKGRGFSRATGKKITRTIIEYYPSCPNCGGTREEGKDVCSYCGSSMIKSKNEVKEENIPKEDKGVLSYSTDGDYRFSDNPNRYVRVHVVPVPVSSHSTGRSYSSSSRSSSSHHSSCAHSSCACACACACAGGGRAGCTTKDFYNTDFKLSYLARKNSIKAKDKSKQ